MTVLLPSTSKEAATEPESALDDSARSTGIVLVVDDEAAVQRVAQRILEHSGFTVLTASDGREAIEVYRERGQDISVVLLDMKMPHLDGEETFLELQVNSERKNSATISIL